MIQTVISCDACGKVHRFPGERKAGECMVGVIRVEVMVHGNALAVAKYACADGANREYDSCLRQVLSRLAVEGILT